MQVEHWQAIGSDGGGPETAGLRISDQQSSGLPLIYVGPRTDSWICDRVLGHRPGCPPHVELNSLGRFRPLSRIEKEPHT